MKTDKKIKILDFKLTKSIGNSLFGMYKSKFYGHGIDFSEHKEYIFGDSIKNIDWKASAKGEKMYTKLFEEERDLKVLFLLDLNESMFFGLEEKTKMDILEEVFYAISFSSYKNNDSIGAYLFTEKNIEFFPYMRNIGNIFKVIKTIEKLKNEKKTSFKKGEKKDLFSVLEILKKRNTKNTLIFILTDELNLENNQNLLRGLSLQNEVVFISIFDFFENNLEKINLNLVFENNGKFLETFLNNDKKINDYSKKRILKLNNFKNIMRKNNVLNISLDTKKDVFKELYLAFNK